MYDSNVLRFVVFMVMYALVLAMVVLYAFAEGDFAAKSGYRPIGSVSMFTLLFIYMS